MHGKRGTAILAGVFAVALVLGAVATCQEWPLAWCLLGISIVLGSLLAILWLTARLSGDMNEQRLSSLVRTSYVLTLLALFGPLMLFTIIAVFPPIRAHLPDAPVGLVKGCASRPNAERRIGACGADGPEWVVNLGAQVSPFEWHSPQTRARIERLKGIQVPDASAATRATLGPAIDTAMPVLDELADGPERATLEKAIADARALPDDAGQEAVTLAFSHLLDARTAVVKRLERESGIRELTGGLRVPLYFVILAILGGAVSLGRRVPEIQGRAIPAYRIDYKKRVATEPTLKTPLSLDAAREHLVFQLMQLVSAPFVALAAWALVEPEKWSSTVATGFIAGFASEPVLLWIRALAERVRPGAGSSAPAGGTPPVGVAPPDDSPTPNDPGHARKEVDSALANLSPGPARN